MLKLKLSQLLLVLICTSTAFAQHDSFQLNFYDQLSKAFARRGLSLAELSQKQILALSYHSVNGTESVAINGEQIMNIASIGKWSCAVAAAELITHGKIELSLAWDDESAGSVITRGDLHAMMQASSNSAANRICTLVNAVASPGFENGSQPCFSNALMDKLGINHSGRGILNINLFNGGQNPRCLGDQDRFQRLGAIRKTTNVGTANGINRLMQIIHQRSDWNSFEWLRFNPHHQGRSGDEIRTPVTNRFYSAFGCQNHLDCPLVMRKTGAISASPAWDLSFSDSGFFKMNSKEFFLTVLCNEPSSQFCNQQLFDAVAEAIRKIENNSL